MNHHLQKARLAVGADGSGTTFERIVQACTSGELDAEVRVLFTNKTGIGALGIADEHRIPKILLAGRREDRTSQLTDALTETFAPIDLICLAGYLKLFPAELVQRFRGRVLNSHPAIDMKRFGGEGMYGIHVAQAELSAGVTETGSTIHFVNEKYDLGAVILQSHINVKPDDSAESLLSRKLPLERELYIQAIKKVLENETELV